MCPAAHCVSIPAGHTGPALQGAAVTRDVGDAVPYEITEDACAGDAVNRQISATASCPAGDR